MRIFGSSSTTSTGGRRRSASAEDLRQIDPQVPCADGHQGHAHHHLQRSLPADQRAASSRARSLPDEAQAPAAAARSPTPNAAKNAELAQRVAERQRRDEDADQERAGARQGDRREQEPVRNEPATGPPRPSARR